MNAPPPPHKGLARATFLNLSGLLVPVILQIATVPLYIKLIGTDRYGIMALVWLMLGYFGVFDFGFGRAMASRIAAKGDDEAARQRIFWTGTCLSIFTGAAGGFLLFAAARHLFGGILPVPPDLRPETEAALPFLALALPVITGISALSGTLQGCEAFGAMNISQMTGSVLYQLFPLLVAICISPGLPGLVLSAIAGRLITAAMLFVFCLARVPARLRPVFALAEIRPLLAYGGWITLTALISPLLTVFDRFVIAALAGMSAVAAYTIPYNLVMRIAALPASLQNALFPRFATVDAREAEALHHDAVKIIAGIMTPALVAGVLLIKPFLHLWLGGNLGMEAAPVGQVLLLGLWANVLAFIPFGFLQSRNRPDVPAKFHAAELVFYAPALYFCTRWEGAAGAAAAWDARSFADALLLFAALRTLPLLLACWPGFAVLALAFTWARLGATPLLHWSGSAAVFAMSTGWALKTLPKPVKARLLMILPLRRLKPAQS